jgi:hypothetical protein
MSTVDIEPQTRFSEFEFLKKFMEMRLRKNLQFILNTSEKKRVNETVKDAREFLIHGDVQYVRTVDRELSRIEKAAYVDIEEESDDDEDEESEEEAVDEEPAIPVTQVTASEEHEDEEANEDIPPSSSLDAVSELTDNSSASSAASSLSSVKKPSKKRSAESPAEKKTAKKKTPFQAVKMQSLVEEAVGKVSTNPFSMFLPSSSKASDVDLEEILKGGKPTTVTVPLHKITDSKLVPYREKISILTSHDLILPAGCVIVMCNFETFQAELHSFKMYCL